MPSGNTSRFGLFGKIPATGDFVRGNLAESFVGPWDRWLQEGIAEARAQLGATWNAAYLSAPIWRFTLASGLAGANAALGVMMPSVDRVGRQFPLTLATPCPESTSPFLDHFSSGQLFEALEDIALRALDQELGRDEILAQITEQPPVIAARPPKYGLVPGTLVLRETTDARRDIASCGVSGAFRAASVWSCHVSGHENVLACEGMPRSGQMIGLFDLSAPVWSEVAQA